MVEAPGGRTLPINSGSRPGLSVDLRCRIGRRPRRAPAGAQRSVRWFGGSVGRFLITKTMFLLLFGGSTLWSGTGLFWSHLGMIPRIHARDARFESEGGQAEGRGEGRCCCRAFGRRLRGGAGGGGGGGSGVRRRAARASSRAATAAAASAWATTVAAPAAATAAAAWATATAAVAWATATAGYEPVAMWTNMTHICSNRPQAGESAMNRATGVE